jgi:hypothetical protein
VIEAITWVNMVEHVFQKSRVMQNMKMEHFSSSPTLLLTQLLHNHYALSHNAVSMNWQSRCLEGPVP